MIRITGFQFISGNEEKRISYTYSELDADGNVTKNNIRKSTVVKDTDVETLASVGQIMDFLKAKES